MRIDEEQDEYQMLNELGVQPGVQARTRNPQQQVAAAMTTYNSRMNIVKTVRIGDKDVMNMSADQGKQFKTVRHKSVLKNTATNFDINHSTIKSGFKLKGDGPSTIYGCVSLN